MSPRLLRHVTVGTAFLILALMVPTGRALAVDGEQPVEVIKREITDQGFYVHPSSGGNGRL